MTEVNSDNDSGEDSDEENLYEKILVESEEDLTDEEDVDFDPESEEQEDCQDRSDPIVTRATSRQESQISRMYQSHSFRMNFKNITGYTGNLTPDLGIFHGAGNDIKTRIPRAQRANVEISLIDFTYALESRENIAQRCADKHTHYAPLIRDLKVLGFKRVYFIPIVAGMRGWHPKMFFDSLKSLHIRPVRLTKLANDITKTAWKYARAIIGTRRRAEATEEFKHKSGLYAFKTNKRYAKGWLGMQ